ncbi:MAG: TRAP transporter substrate-binding protein DctP [Alphaproteobacteria bacterium]
MNRRFLASVCAVALGLGLNAAVAAEVTLKAITAFPRTNLMNQPFHDLVEELNAKGKGSIRIRYLGGPEVTPVQEQMGALQRGVVDVYYGPSSYFDGQIPEVGAQNASNKTAMELRKDGGQALLNEAFNKRANGQYLGYYGSGYTFHIYLKQKPKMLTNGMPDLTGVKVRGATVYRPFYETLGINTVLVQFSEIHSALERGVIEGVGWTNLAITDGGWDKFLKYRIFPTYWQGDIALVMNHDAWKKLDAQQQKLLTDLVVASEAKAHEYFKTEVEKQSQKLKASGMQDIVLEGAAAKTYSRNAFQSLWDQLGKRISADEVARYRKVFYSE